MGDKLVPLSVDLDGTLVCTDILWESVIQLWRRPTVAVRVLLALLLRGKAEFKTVLAEEVTIDPATLPYREDVLAYIRLQRGVGRDVVLATATHRIVAHRIAEYLGVFSRVFATDSSVNLAGEQKRDALESSYGKRGFDYIGNDQKDLPIFAAAREAFLVDPSQSLLERASAFGNVVQVFSRGRTGVLDIALAMRLHQWAKNVLLAVPLVTAHLVMEIGAWISFAIAFFAFGLVASATYLVNDLIDLHSDRLSPQKRNRPIASGRVAIPIGLITSIVVGLLGIIVSFVLLPSRFVAYLILYVALTLSYSLDLKRRLFVDVLALALLYTLRILAGGAAIGVVVSEWLLMFSLFFFVSLAFLKRAIEIKDTESEPRVTGRGYYLGDLETIRVIGVSTGLISALVLALYISSPAVTQLYRSPQLLWLVCPLLIYWVARIWILAARGQVHHDPVVFALVDWLSYVAGACVLAIIFIAMVGPAEFYW